MLLDGAPDAEGGRPGRRRRGFGRGQGRPSRAEPGLFVCFCLRGPGAGQGRGHARRGLREQREGYLRFSYANSAENLGEALRRLEAFLARRSG